MQKAAQAYLQTQVTTTTQGELLLLLYDGAIKFLTQAKDKIAERDYAGKGILISKALDIVNELDASLNMEKGGELAQNLHKLYFYCSTRLLNANLKMDVAFIDEVIKILSGLRGAYGQIVNTPEAMAIGASMAANRAPANVAPSRAPLPPTQMPPLGRPAQFGRAHAQAYGQQAAADDAPRPEAQAPQAAPVQAAQPVARQAGPAAPQGTPAAPQTTAPQNISQAAPANTPSVSGAPGTPSTEDQPAKGFAPSRMAAANLYRKFAQS